MILVRSQVEMGEARCRALTQNGKHRNIFLWNNVEMGEARCRALTQKEAVKSVFQKLCRNGRSPM